MGWLGSILAGSNGTLGGDINQSGQIAGFGQSLGEGDLQNASGFYNDILSGNSAKQAAALAPEISNIQKQGQQQIDNGSPVWKPLRGDQRIGAEQHRYAAWTGEQHGFRSDGNAASGLSSIGSNALNTGLSANAQQADESQQQMQNWQNSILGKGLSTWRIICRNGWPRRIGWRNGPEHWILQAHRRWGSWFNSGF